MKKLNIPLILFLLVGAMVSVVGIHFLHGYQVSRSAESLLARATQAAENGDTDEQVRLLRRYLRHRPENLDAKKTLYRVVRERSLNDSNADWREFFRNIHSLENTLRDHPDDEGLRREAYLSFKIMGRYADAIDHLEELKLLNALTAEDYTAWGILLWMKSDMDEAVELLAAITGFDTETLDFTDKPAEESEADRDEDTSVASTEGGAPYAPEQVQAYMTLAAIYLQNRSSSNDLAVPNRIVDKAIERNEDSADAYIKRAQFTVENYKGREGREKCIDDVRKALELAPDDLSVTLYAVQRALAIGDYDWAEQILDAGMEHHTDSPAFYRMYAESASAQGNVEDAISRINLGLEEFTLNTQLLAKRAEFEIELNQIEAAKQTIARLNDKKNISSVYIRYLQALVDMAEKNYLKASQELERLRNLVPGDGWMRRRFDERLSICYRFLNMPDKLQQMSSSRDDVQSRYAHTLALMTQGRFDQAVEQITELLRNEDLTDDGKSQLRVRLYQAMIGQQQNLPPARRDWSRVERLAGMMTKDLDEVQKDRFEIELLIQKDMRSEALKRTEEAIRTHRQEPQFRYLLAKLTKDHDQAMSILSRLEESSAEPSPDIQLARIERLASMSDTERVRTELAKIKDRLGDYKSVDRPRILAAVMATYQAAGLLPEALAVGRERLESDEQSIGVVLNVFDMAVVADDAEVMDLAQAKLAQIATKNSAEWMLCEAQRLMMRYRHDKDSGVELDDVMRLVLAAREKRPSFAPVFRLQADVELAKGDDEAAAESLRKAVDLRPNEVAYQRRLYQLLVDNNRFTEAQDVLARMPRTAQRGTSVLAEIEALLAQDPKQAVAKAEEAFSPDSDDFATLLQLAEVYSRAQQSASVESVMKRALSIDKTNQRAWLLLVRALVAQNRSDEAKAAIREAATSIEENTSLAVGQLYATVGDYEQALQSYENGLKEDPQNATLLVNVARLHQFHQQEAAYLKTLDRIIAIEDTSDPVAKASVTEARRLKAQQLAASGVYSDFHAAVALLEQNRTDRGKMLGEDLRLWLQLHASRPEVSSRQAAMDRLVEMQRERDLSIEETMILASLRHRAGEWDDAKTLLIDIMAKSPDNPQFIATYIEWLLERDETTEAKSYLKRLDPTSTRAIQFRSMILAQQGNPKDAYANLKRHIPKQINHLQAAMMLERLGEYDARFFGPAKKHWQTHLKNSPQQTPNYIDFLARVPNAGGLDDALDLAEGELKKAVADKKPDLAQFYIGIGLKALRSGRGDIPNDSPQYARVYKWLSAGKQAGIDDVTLMWNQFDFFDVRRDVDRLKQLYLKFLERTDITELQRAVVRNNLAYLYALSNQGDQALAVIGDAISQLGPRSDFLDTRGLAYLVSGQINNAVADLREAAKGQPFDPGLLFHLALAEHKAGNSQQAAEALKRALDMGLDKNELSAPEARLLESLQAELERGGMLSAT